MNKIVVEVPGIVNKEGVCGLKLENYPADFSSLLMNQVSVMQLTAEAILADPVVDNAVQAEKLLGTMIEIQKQHLGYLI